MIDPNVTIISVPEVKDDLTLTIRLHDPKEKQDPKKSASWVVITVHRADLDLPKNDFIERYVAPALPQLNQLRLK